MLTYGRFQVDNVVSHVKLALCLRSSGASIDVFLRNYTEEWCLTSCSCVNHNNQGHFQVECCFFAQVKTVLLGVQVDHVAASGKQTVKKIDAQIAQVEADIAAMQGVIEKGTKVERHILGGGDVRDLTF